MANKHITTMSVQIVTDSSSELENSFHPSLHVVPLNVRFGNDEYQDGVNLSREEFYNRLIEEDTLPQTSAASPVAFEEAVLDAKKNGDEVLLITLSSKLSGTYQSAKLGIADLEDVYLVDSMTVCLGLQILVRRALELSDQGLSAAEIAKILEEEKGRVRLVALLDTLEYLKKGGRISAAAAAIGNLLSIRPVIAVEDGEVKMLGKARGSKKANNLLNEMIEKSGGIAFDYPSTLGYTGLNDDLLRKYVEDSKLLSEKYKNEANYQLVGPTIGTHAGPGAIALAFFAQND